MKTLTKSLFAAMFTVVLMSATTMSSMAANTVKVANLKKSYNKIWVAGNVKLILTQSEKEGVFVDDSFNPQKTSLISKGQTLFINTMQGNQVTIRISLKDLLRIEAAGSAVVEMDNKFDLKYLQLFLSQSAKVKVNASIQDLYTVVSEDATVKMWGASNYHTLIASNMKNVKLDNFVCQKTERSGMDMMIASDSLIAVKAK